MANSVDPDQTAPIGAVCSGSTLCASILNFISNARQLLYPPQTLFVVGILFSRCPSVRASVCPSVRNVLFS